MLDVDGSTPKGSMARGVTIPCWADEDSCRASHDSLTPSVWNEMVNRTVHLLAFGISFWYLQSPQVRS